MSRAEGMAGAVTAAGAGETFRRDDLLAARLGGVVVSALVSAGCVSLVAGCVDAVVDEGSTG